MTIRLGTLVTGIAALATVAAAWLFLGPAQLGGSTSYVETYGTSMQPRFHAGDLVLVRGASDYHVGEIAAYRNAQLGGHVVLHRIIGFADGRYTFKGDNNSFVDSYHPTRAELVGRAWIHVPALGRYLVWLRGRNLFLLAGVGALVALLAAGVRRRPRRPSEPRPGTGGRGGLGIAPAAAAAAALACAGLAALSFARPVTAPALRSGLYTQTGRFAYDAAVPGGAAVYGGTSATTGQPLFMKLVHSARFRFSYSFASTAAHAVDGRIALDAVVSSPNGWTHTLRIVPAQPFSGDRATVSGVLDFRPLLGLLRRVDALGNVTGGTYTLTLAPRVQVHATVGGTALAQTFAPELPFLLDPNQLQLQPGGANGAPASGSLVQTSSGSGAAEAPATIGLLKLRLPVARARQLSVAGGVAALLALVGTLLLARRRRPAHEHERIARAWGDLIVDVAALPSSVSAGVVRTSSFEGIARVAEQTGHVIMHVERAGRHTYAVEDGGVRYEYGVARAVSAPEPALRLAEGS